MPGICGLLVRSPERELAPLLSRMMDSMKDQSWYQESSFCSRDKDLAFGRISLGIVNTEPQPAQNEDGSLCGLLEGEIYNYQELRRSLAISGHVFQGHGHAELLLHGFEQEGIGFFSRLNGIFSAAIWDAAKQRLYLVNDRFGIKPIYFVMQPDQLLFASQIKSLLINAGVSRQFNLRGLAQFFTFGQLFGNDTFYQAIQLLPAASCLVYDLPSNQLEVEKYYEFSPITDIKPGQEMEYLDRISAAFKAAVDRRTTDTENLGISLSGGLDARTILGVVDPACPITCVTMGMLGSIDHRSSQKMAELAKRPYHRYTLDEKFLNDFEEHIQHMVHLTDGHYLSQCLVMPTLPFYRQLGIKVLLRGHAGELMHMDKAYNFSHGLGLESITTTEELGNWLWGRTRTHMLEETGGELFAPAIQPHMEALARESLRQGLQEFEHIESPTQRISHLFLAQRTRRETAISMVEFNSLVETRLPYVDNDLVDLVLSAPPGLKQGDRIQSHILRRHMPSFLRVVNSNTSAPMEASKWRCFFARAKLKVLSKLRVPGFQPYERLGLWLRQQLRPFVEKLLLSPRCLDRAVFNPDTLREVIRLHMTGKANHTFLLLALMIFEVGQRQFIDEVNFTEPVARPNEAWRLQFPAFSLTSRK